MAIISKTKDGVKWVKVYNAGGTSIYEPACGGTWLSFWKSKMNWPSNKNVRCAVNQHQNENEGNTVIAGGHVRYAGENGHDWHLVPICQKRNKEVAEGKENTDDCFWVKLDMVYDLQPGDSRKKQK